MTIGHYLFVELIEILIKVYKYGAKAQWHNGKTQAL
jgi:hypothetical protein